MFKDHATHMYNHTLYYCSHQIYTMNGEIRCARLSQFLKVLFKFSHEYLGIVK